jgi:hypothetical protein
VRVTAAGWELLRSGAIPLERLRQAAAIAEDGQPPAAPA